MIIRYQIDLESIEFIPKEEVRIMLKRLAKVKRIQFKYYKEGNTETYAYPEQYK